jgi:hypothetical protein
MTWRLLPGTGGSWSYLGSDGGGGIVGGGPSPGVGPYVLKAGDTMSGALTVNAQVQSNNLLALAATGLGAFSPYLTPRLHVKADSMNVHGWPAASGTYDNAVITRVSMGGGAIDFGIYDSGTAWIQSRYIGSLASNFALALNPNGGNVGIGLGAADPGQKLSVGGNLWLTSVGPRFYADTSSASNNARFMFLNSAANANTVFAVAPRGTGTVAGVRLFSTETPDSVAGTQVTLTVGTLANAAHLSTLPVAGGVGGPIYLSPNNNNRFIFQPDDTATSPALNVTGGVLANRYSERLQSIGPALNAAVTIDWNAGSTVYLAVNGANTINHVNHTGANVMFHFLMIECAGNFNTLVWPGVAWSGGTKPSIAGSALVSLMCRDGSYIFGTVVWRQV